eukprot:TRINITY_DN3005_c0_g3_i1.p1 TRINITY_DN3005_c0_g3~~TRINITY_DN3005_c0_g3_i1.p1  ORF type:complete len:563 (-),score=86.09 TRINITY_DN3005_c0_g3_i1:169-1857(-)
MDVQQTEWDWPPSAASWAALEAKAPRLDAVAGAEAVASGPPAGTDVAAEELREGAAVGPLPVTCMLPDNLSTQESECHGDVAAEELREGAAVDPLPVTCMLPDNLSTQETECHGDVAAGELREGAAPDPLPVTCMLPDNLSAQEMGCHRDSRLSSVLTLPESLGLGEASDDDIPIELPMTPMRDRVMPNKRLAKPSPKILRELATMGVGETVDFGRPTNIAGRECTHAVIEKEFRSASHARLVRLLPCHGRFVFKRADVRQEAAIMCTLRCMNKRWRRLDVRACGVPVEAITYDICPLSLEAGCLEAVSDSWNFRELAQGYTSANRHLRVFEKVHGDRACLDRLAATTVAYLTAGYALGLRDSHDDNIMLRNDGSLFRVDFGYMFGVSPTLDAPATAVPNAVYVALGEARWKEVVVVCERALMALSGDTGREPPAWDCIRSVPEMSLLHDEAFAYARGLSLEAFRAEVQSAKEWSVSRTAKNRIREVVRFLTEDSGKPAVPESVRHLAPIRLPSLPFHYGGDGDSPTPEAELPRAIRSLWKPNSNDLWSFHDENDPTNVISL